MLKDKSELDEDIELHDFESDDEHEEVYNKPAIIGAILLVVVAIAIVIKLVFGGVSTETDPNGISGQTPEAQEEMYNATKEATESDIPEGAAYVVQEDYGVYLGVTPREESWGSGEEAVALEHEALATSALTYEAFGAPGEGNYILFGHNAEGFASAYFTPFVENLKEDDIVTIKTHDGDYNYKITSREVVPADGSADDKVFYQIDKNDTPIITIGTCEYPESGTPNRIIWTGELI